MNTKKIVIFKTKGKFYFLNNLTQRKSSPFKTKLEGLRILVGLKDKDDHLLYDLKTQINKSEKNTEKKALKENYKKTQTEAISNQDMLRLISDLLRLDSLLFYSSLILTKDSDRLNVLFESWKEFISIKSKYKKLHYNSHEENPDMYDEFLPASKRQLTEISDNKNYSL